MKPKKPIIAEKKRGRGRPSKLEPQMIEQIRKLAAKGFTIEEIADFLEINWRTIYNWRDKHPEVDQALSIAGEAADARVQHSLYKQALGYYALDGKGERIFVPPSTTAAIFWLKARQKWRDRYPDDEDAPPMPEQIAGEEKPAESPRQQARRVLFLLNKASKDVA